MRNCALSLTCLCFCLALLREKDHKLDGVEGFFCKESPAEGDCDMRCIQAGELDIASAAPRWLTVVSFAVRLLSL